jgi:hypothetical protein
MPISFANNMQSRIADAGGLPIGGSSFSLQSGDGAKVLARVPGLGSNGVYILATLKNASSERETIKISSITGDVCTISEREVEQEDTEKAWAQDDIVHFVVTAAALAALGQKEDVDQNTSDIAQNASDIADAKVRIVGSDESLSGALTKTFTGLSAGKRYRLEFELYEYLAGATPYRLTMRFGNSGGIDSGNNYSWSHFYGDSTEEGEDNTSDDEVYIVGCNEGPLGSGTLHIVGEIEFSTVPGDSTLVVGHGRCTTVKAGASSLTNYRFDFRYDGSGAVDRVQLIDPLTGNGFTGRARIYKTN